MLPEKKHKAGAVLVHRTPMSLYQGRTLDDVGQLYLFVPRKLWNANFCQLFVDGGCGIFTKNLILIISIGVAAVHVGVFVLVSATLNRVLFCSAMFTGVWSGQ